MRTSCKGCVFADTITWSDTNPEEDLEQVGCKLGRLEAYRDQDKATFDKESKYYFIEGLCKAVRSEKWAAKQTEPIMDAIEKEIRNKISVIIAGTDEAILSSILSLQGQYDFYEVIVSILPSQDVAAILSWLSASVKCKYYIIKEFEASDDWLDVAVAKSTGNYYLLLQEGKTFDGSLVAHLNYHVEDLCRPILFVDSDTPILSRTLHQKLNGCQEKSVFAKFLELPDYQKYTLKVTQ